MAEQQLSLPDIGHNSAVLRFVIFSSYGNDSCAVIQWAHEQKLEGVCVVYSDTGWAASDWRQRVEEKEAWARSLGFQTARTRGISFAELAREKSGFPTQRYQWCSYRLKIEPGMRWLAENDPDCRAVVLVGVRQEESAERSDFPAWLARSENHGGRVMLAPFATATSEARNVYLLRAGIDPLPHRSRECKCVNSNRTDMRFFTPEDVVDIRALEAEIGRPLFRPHRHMGATGIDEVMRWANSPRGKYTPPVGAPPLEDDGLPDENMLGCVRGWECGAALRDDEEIPAAPSHPEGREGA